MFYIVDLDNKVFEVSIPKDRDIENNTYDIVMFMQKEFKRNLIISTEYTSDYCIQQGWKQDNMLLEKLRIEYNEHNSDKHILNI